MRKQSRRSWLQARSVAPVVVAVAIFGTIGVALLASSSAATHVVSIEAESRIDAATGQAGVVAQAQASGGNAVRFGTNTGACDNFCSNPVKPIFRTAPVTVNLNVNSAWCGPTWDAPASEFDLARQKMGAGAIIMPACKAFGGFTNQTPEQTKTLLDKAQAANIKAVIFPGYTCDNAFSHQCYLGMSNPDAAIDRFAYHPALAGIYIVDEPSYQEFPVIQAAVERMRIRRPGLLPYVNLFGSQGYNDARGYLGNVTYDKYLQGYFETVKTTLVSVDDYSSPNGLEYTLKAVERWAQHYMANGRPELAQRVRWSAINTLGGHSGHTLASIQRDMPAYKAVNDKYDFRHLYFTWRAPPEDNLWNHDLTGPGLCGRNNNQRPNTLCGE
jgi:hypothetical protein